MNEEETQDKLDTWGTVGLFIWDFLKVFVIAIAIIIPVRWFLFQPFVVTGDSMRPNFLDGDYLIIDEISYRFREPERGEVVVLRFPNDPVQFFIKRVIALPGERITIEEGRVSIFNKEQLSGLVLTEEYLPSNNLTYGTVDLKLSSNEYYVLGDNRLSSSDSRMWGPLERKELVGRVVIRVFPITKFQVFTTLSYLLTKPLISNK